MTIPAIAAASSSFAAFRKCTAERAIHLTDMALNSNTTVPETDQSLLETGLRKFGLSDFLVGDSNDPLEPPSVFTEWHHAIEWAVELYEPQLLGPPEARTTLHYGGKAHPVINLCSYNYLGLANHPEVIAAAHEALATHGLGACGSPTLSGMSNLHRQLEARMAEFLGFEDAMLFNSGFGGALGTISGLMRKSDVAIMDNRSHLSLRDGAVLARTRVERFEHNDPVSLDAALTRHKSKRRLVIIEGIYSMDGDLVISMRLSTWLTRTGRAFSWTKRTPCLPAGRPAAGPSSISA